MKIVNIHEAKTTLSKLIARAAQGEEIIIGRSGKPVAKLVSVVGFLTTTLTIGLSLLPQPDEPNKPLAMLKVVGLSAVLVLIGVGLYQMGKRRAARDQRAVPAAQHGL